MPTPWEAAVRSRRPKQLTIFGTPGLKSAWGAGFVKRTVDQFNALSGTNTLGLTLMEGNQAPDPNGNGGADVQIDVSTGNHSFNFQGNQTGSLLPPPNINGKCHTVSQVGEIIRAFIFVPIRPTTESGGREIGTGLKVAITLHELLHACGLHETDPGHDTGLNDPDLFRTGASAEFRFPPDGIPGDRLNLGFNRFTPPFFLTARTAGLVRGNWP
jgi:hypothetical protein